VTTSGVNIVSASNVDSFITQPTTSAVDSTPTSFIKDSVYQTTFDPVSTPDTNLAPHETATISNINLIIDDITTKATTGAAVDVVFFL
jgi:hypothetical protein